MEIAELDEQSAVAGTITSPAGCGCASAAMSNNTLAMQQREKARTLAVATERRLPQFPDVSIFRELGYNLVDGG